MNENPDLLKKLVASIARCFKEVFLKLIENINTLRKDDRGIALIAFAAAVTICFCVGLRGGWNKQTFAILALMVITLAILTCRNLTEQTRRWLIALAMILVAYIAHGLFSGLVPKESQRQAYEITSNRVDQATQSVPGAAAANNSPSLPSPSVSEPASSGEMQNTNLPSPPTAPAQLHVLAYGGRPPS